MIDDNHQVQLSDRDLDLVVYRVRESLRADRRWVLRMVITTLVAVVGSIGAAWNANRTADSASQNATNANNAAETSVEILGDRPYIDGLGVSSDEHELIIEGTAFGLSGRVELFYKLVFTDAVDCSETRTPTITLYGDRIRSWTETEIVVTTTAEQRLVFRTSVCNAENFENLVPYLRVVTDDGRRSPVW